MLKVFAAYPCKALLFVQSGTFRQVGAVRGQSDVPRGHGAAQTTKTV